MFELIQNGPVVSWFDVHIPSFGEKNKFRFLAGGVYYQPEVCDSYEEENVPLECVGENGSRYKCVKELDCKNRLPKHCDRFNPEAAAQRPVNNHAVTIVGYGTDRFYEEWAIVEWEHTGCNHLL